MGFMSFMPTTSCDIRRPYGGSIQTEDEPCSIRALRKSDAIPPHLANANVTHILCVGPAVDVQDTASNAVSSTSITLADGDEVRVPSGGSTVYVVLWVDRVSHGTAFEHKRVYLIRRSVTWTDPESAP